MSGDLDGNGSTDAADVYSSGGGAHVLVELAGNGTASATITDADPAGQAPPRALGVARIGGDRDVVFVQVGSGASTRLVGLYSVRGCDLVRLTLPGHDTFAIGGTVTHLDGLQCSDGTLRVNSATTDDGATYATTAQDARVEDGELVTVGDPVTGTLTSADPGLQTIGSLDCANIDAPL